MQRQLPCLRLEGSGNVFFAVGISISTAARRQPCAEPRNTWRTQGPRHAAVGKRRCDAYLECTVRGFRLSAAEMRLSDILRESAPFHPSFHHGCVSRRKRSDQRQHPHFAVKPIGNMGDDATKRGHPIVRTGGFTRDSEPSKCMHAYAYSARMSRSRKKWMRAGGGGYSGGNRPRRYSRRGRHS